MIYALVKSILFFGFRAFFKKLNVVGWEKVPKDKALLITPNHSNAFLDAIIIGGTLPGDFYFLTRGDVFRNKVAAFFLRALHQTPIFRIRDGYEQLKNNEETFKEVYRNLDLKRRIMIFPEGDCVQEKKVRPLKKGLARMAFEYMEQNKWAKDVYIVPAGIRYANYRQIRSDVTVVFGQPIRVGNYNSLFLENPALAHKKLSEDVYTSIQACILEVKEENADLVEELLTFYKANFTNGDAWQFSSEVDFKNLKRITKISETANAERFIKSFQSYFQLRQKFGVSDKALALYANGHYWLFKYFLLFVPGFLGLLIHKPMYDYSRKKASSIVKNIEFFGSMWLGTLIGIYVIITLACWVILGSIWGFFQGVFISFLIYLTGLAAIHWKESQVLQKQIKILTKNSGSDLEKLLSLRNDLKEELNSHF